MRLHRELKPAMTAGKRLLQAECRETNQNMYRTIRCFRECLRNIDSTVITTDHTPEGILNHGSVIFVKTGVCESQSAEA